MRKKTTYMHINTGIEEREGGERGEEGGRVEERERRRGREGGRKRERSDGGREGGWKREWGRGERREGGKVEERGKREGTIGKRISERGRKRGREGTLSLAHWMVCSMVAGKDLRVQYGTSWSGGSCCNKMDIRAVFPPDPKLNRVAIPHPLAHACSGCGRERLIDRYSGGHRHLLAHCSYRAVYTCSKGQYNSCWRKITHFSR